MLYDLYVGRCCRTIMLCCLSLSLYFGADALSRDVEVHNSETSRSKGKMIRRQMKISSVKEPQFSCDFLLLVFLVFFFFSCFGCWLVGCFSFFLLLLLYVLKWPPCLVCFSGNVQLSDCVLWMYI